MVPRSTPGLVAVPGTAVELAAGLGHVCARIDDGTVYCWGNNMTGQCGRDPLAGAMANRVRTPMAVPGISGATELAAGDAFTCARVAGGFRCWGENTNGQLGNGTMMNNYMPQAVLGWP
jgi:alpha-tubulin suppressor-like RCC1 family protein